eukprot:scaffold10581_cov117-Isochrysis_galbana.AAC.5
MIRGRDGNTRPLATRSAPGRLETPRDGIPLSTIPPQNSLVVVLSIATFITPEKETTVPPVGILLSAPRTTARDGAARLAVAHAQPSADAPCAVGRPAHPPSDGSLDGCPVQGVAR